MEYRYSVVQETGEGEAYSFGIQVISQSCGCSTVVEIIRDVCSDEKKITQLVDMCNTLRLDYVHLYDVIDDFLSDIQTKPKRKAGRKTQSFIKSIERQQMDEQSQTSSLNGSKTRTKVYEETVLLNFPLYCPKCKKEYFRIL